MGKIKAPNYLKDINALLPDGRMRWFDEFKDATILAPSIQPGVPNDMTLKDERNICYAKWLAAFCVSSDKGTAPMLAPKQMIWQVVQVMSFKHSESNSNDWWEPYQDCLFRVFVQPETIYHNNGEHKQWYLLSPEDCYIVNKIELEAAGNALPPREYNGRERWLSGDRRLRRARLIPVECCRHWRHETTAGELPEGL